MGRAIYIDDFPPHTVKGCTGEWEVTGDGFHDVIYSRRRDVGLVFRGYFVMLKCRTCEASARVKADLD